MCSQDDELQKSQMLLCWFVFGSVISRVILNLLCVLVRETWVNLLMLLGTKEIQTANAKSKDKLDGVRFELEVSL